MAFNIGFYANAIIGHTANHLLPQLLMEHFDSLPIQCRHLNICMKEFTSEKNTF